MTASHEGARGGDSGGLGAQRAGMSLMCERGWLLALRDGVTSTKTHRGRACNFERLRTVVEHFQIAALSRTRPDWPLGA